MVRRVTFGIVLLAGAYLVAVQVAADRPWSDVALSAIALTAYCLISGLIVFRRNGHLTGWLLAVLGLVLVFGDASPYLPGVSETWATWIGSWVWTSVFAVFAALTLTFPAGHGPQGRGLWPRAGRVALWSLPILVAVPMFTETTGGPPDTSGRANEIGFLPGGLAYAALFTVVLILVSGAISLVVRRRRAVGTERAQITWVVFGLVLLAVAICLTFVFVFGSIVLGYDDPGEDAWGPAWLTMITFPLWFGVAILRYRLFDIDRIISRTVSYTLVAALLAGLFALVVTVLSSLLPSGSDLSVAVSTLLVAALFNPLRRRVQSMVDRRFNRSRYNAMRVGNEFAEMMRDEVDAGRIVGTWMEVVDRTMQPTAASVWIRDEPGLRPTALRSPRFRRSE